MLNIPLQPWKCAALRTLFISLSGQVTLYWVRTAITTVIITLGRHAGKRLT